MPDARSGSSAGENGTVVDDGYGDVGQKTPEPESSESADDFSPMQECLQQMCAQHQKPSDDATSSELRAAVVGLEIKREEMERESEASFRPPVPSLSGPAEDNE